MKLWKCHSANVINCDAVRPEMRFSCSKRMLVGSDIGGGRLIMAAMAKNSILLDIVKVSQIVLCICSDSSNYCIQLRESSIGIIDSELNTVLAPNLDIIKTFPSNAPVMQKYVNIHVISHFRWETKCWRSRHMGLQITHKKRYPGWFHFRRIPPFAQRYSTTTKRTMTFDQNVVALRDDSFEQRTERSSNCMNCIRQTTSVRELLTRTAVCWCKSLKKKTMFVPSSFRCEYIFATQILEPWYVYFIRPTGYERPFPFPSFGVHCSLFVCVCVCA